MKNILELGAKKQKYFDPIVEILIFNRADILCMSKDEQYDNEFDASEMGDF